MCVVVCIFLSIIYFMCFGECTSSFKRPQPSGIFISPSIAASNAHDKAFHKSYFAVLRATTLTLTLSTSRNLEQSGAKNLRNITDARFGARRAETKSVAEVAQVFYARPICRLKIFEYI